MSTAVRYTIAVAVTAIAIALTLALPQLLAPMRFFFLWCAVLVSAVASGTGPGLMSVVISLIAASIILFHPFGSVSVHFTEDVLRLTLFGAFAAALSVAVGERRRAQVRAAELNERLRNEVSERTRHEANAAFISHASELLATSLSHIETLRNLARLCVPAMGDWCAVHIGADETYERLAIEHRDPAKLRMLEDLGRLARPTPDKDAIYSVLTTRKTQLIADFPEETLRALSLTSVQFELLQNLGFRSWIIAPMIARGRVLGALTVVCGESGRRYSEQDVPVIEDLARRAAVAIDNARLYEAAESANRAKDEFLATLSHELRTPLTAISGWAHMLDLGMTDEATTKLAVGTIIRSAKAQAELIDDLLDLSRVVAGTLRLNLADVDLARLVAEVVLAAKPAADAKSIQLELASPSQPVMVRGDDRRLRQILWNLTTNAVKFTNEGSISVSLSIVGGAYARLEVTDTGRGIDPAFLPHVWDRFRQADSSTSREFGGLGLGLAVVKHLVEMHGGAAIAGSAGLGHGATFRVDLPLARVLPLPASEERPVDTGRLAGKRILVVDDDEDARLVLAAMLRQDGATVTGVASADEAMQQFASQRFDAVLSDLSMPGGDGYSLVRRLHAIRDVPVIAVSAIGIGADDRKRAIGAGFAEFVRKPVDPDELVATVAGLS